MDKTLGDPMKNLDRLIIIVSFFYFFITGCSGQDPYQWITALPKPWTLSENQVSELLPKFHERFPNFHQRLKAINIWRVGTPYGIFKLGEEIEPDPDPILRIDTSDCTVHVLTSIAFTNSKDWEQTRNETSAYDIVEKLLEHMEKDKKNTKDTLKLILPNQKGEIKIVSCKKTPLLFESIQKYFDSIWE